MAKYAAFLGRKVEVLYRAGDILLPASGTMVADSGRSIFLEQHFVQRGLKKNFRWEIPYQYVVRLEEKSEPPDSPEATLTPAPAPETAAPASSVRDKEPERARPTRSILPFPKPTQNRLIF